MSGPERIWVEFRDPYVDIARWNGDMGGEPHIRADLAAAKDAEIASLQNWIAAFREAGELTDGIRDARIADLTRQLAEARDKALEEAALVADVERHARLARQVANSDLIGITLMHGQVAEAMKSLAAGIRNLKGTP